jgi:putative hydrolase of HD superfamily
MDDDLKGVANYLFEAGILNKTPRSGFWFLGSGEQSVAEHIHRMMHVAFVLAKMEGADASKVIQMALFHDFAEGRTSDLNWIHQKYVTSDEEKALNDSVKNLPFGQEIKDLLSEYEERESLEARLVKDADHIELLLSLKEQQDVGNNRAATWIPSLMMRLKTESGKKLAEAVIVTPSDDWWFSEKDKADSWWVDRNGKKA